MKNTRILLLAGAISCASCNVATPEIVEFAVNPRIVEVGADGGEYTSEIYSNRHIDVTVKNAGDWAELKSAASYEGDGEIVFEFEPNEGLRRGVTAYVNYNNGAIVDSVRFMQDGEKAVLKVSSANVFIDRRTAAAAEIALETNIAPQDIDLAVDYLSGQGGWISNAGIMEDRLVIDWDRNSPSEIQKARLTLSFTDGWGESVSRTINILLSDDEGAFGKQTSFSEVRNLPEGRIDQFLFIRSVVVSDCESKNMEMNHNTDFNKVDVTPSERTAYVESEDGEFGFRLVFNDSGDNTLKHKQLINLHLNSLELIKEHEPLRYTLRGLSNANVEQIGEVESLPSKVKMISELDDNDVYTFVELKETEFANKEGSFANVHDKYTLASSFNTTKVSTKVNGDCWAGMLLDSDGRAIYAMVNMLCPWRRNGSGVPQGVGSMKGIIVHNEQPRYGDLGRYQIRAVDKSGYAQKLTSSSSYSVVAKWDGKPYAYNFNNYGSFFPYAAGNEGMDSIIPSDDFNKSTGAHTAELSFENKMGMPSSGTKSLRPCQSLNGVTMGSNGGTVSGRALSIQCNIAGWYNWKEDGSIDSYNGIVASLPTTRMEGKRLFFYYAYFIGGTNYATFKNFPARWCVEYSIDNGESYTICKTIESDKEYSHLRSYQFEGPTVISGRDYYPNYSVGLGQTEHMVEIPSEAMGREKVLIRLRPYDTFVTSLPEDLCADIENAQAYDGISIYQDLRFDRIIILSK